MYWILHSCENFYISYTWPSDLGQKQCVLLFFRHSQRRFKVCHTLPEWIKKLSRKGKLYMHVYILAASAGEKQFVTLYLTIFFYILATRKWSIKTDNWQAGRRSIYVSHPIALPVSFNIVFRHSNAFSFGFYLWIVFLTRNLY